MPTRRRKLSPVAPPTPPDTSGADSHEVSPEGNEAAVLALLPDEAPARKKRAKAPSLPHKNRRHKLTRSKKDIEAATHAIDAKMHPPIPSGNPSEAGTPLWRFRRAVNDGRPRRFTTPQDFRRECESYFLWVYENPLIEFRTVLNKGIPVEIEVKKVRMMTIQALCLHLSITPAMWSGYRTKDGFKKMVRHVDSVIYTQKIESAAADLLNANIIVRDLGLKDRTDVTSGDEPITQISRKIMSVKKPRNAGK